MKTLFLTITVSAFVFASCNSGGDRAVKENISKRTATTETAAGDPVGSIVAAYIDLKNALVKDNDKDAAGAGSELLKALDNFEKSRGTQSKETQEIIDDAKEHAEHIESNAGNIEHQREHFLILSEDVYDLIKTAGSKLTLYYTYCPMYNNGKGARWLSETREIKNPYLGAAMPECGTVEEELNQ